MAKKKVVSKPVKKKMVERDILTRLKDDKDLKKKFIKGLNRLGFPMEFSARKYLINRGYEHVNEGHFMVEENEKTITKSYDISAYRRLEKEILKNNKIRVNLQLIGDCKFSIEKGNILLAIPDKSVFENKAFIGPLLTNFQTAYYDSYRHSQLASNFIKDFGKIFIASDVKDTHINAIMRPEGETTKYNKGPRHEKIFNIVEKQILPPCQQQFLRGRINYYHTYKDYLYLEKTPEDVQYYIDKIKGVSCFGSLIIPIIITSKKIVAPILNDNWDIVDIEEKEFILYTHSVYNPEDYFEILDNYIDIGIFICNEKYFDKLSIYLENIHKIIFFKIVSNITQFPTCLCDDIGKILEHNEEIKNRKGKGYLN